MGTDPHLNAWSLRPREHLLTARPIPAILTFIPLKRAHRSRRLPLPPPHNQQQPSNHGKTLRVGMNLRAMKIHLSLPC